MANNGGGGTTHDRMIASGKLVVYSSISGTLADLVAGRDLAFEDRGLHRLRGVPGEWQLMSALTG
ncbi:MAG TPA: hypothetical protein VF743_09480 [Acidimicrobiales bacterium]